MHFKECLDSKVKTTKWRQPNLPEQATDTRRCDESSCPDAKALPLPESTPGPVLDEASAEVHLLEGLSGHLQPGHLGGGGSGAPEAAVQDVLNVKP